MTATPGAASADRQAVRKGLSQGTRLALSLLACVLVLLTYAGRTAASFSDTAGTRACWLRQPYALLKNQRKGGKAELIRGRERESFWDFDYDGVVPLETVETDVERIALTPRYAILELAGRGLFRYSLVELADGQGQPVPLEGEQELRRYLADRGEGGTPVTSQSFEAVYEVRRTPDPCWKGFACGLGCVAFVLLPRGFACRRWLLRSGKRTALAADRD